MNVHADVVLHIHTHTQVALHVVLPSLHGPCPYIGKARRENVYLLMGYAECLMKILLLLCMGSSIGRWAMRLMLRDAEAGFEV